MSRCRLVVGLLSGLLLSVPVSADWLYVPRKLDPNSVEFTRCPYRLAREYFRTSRSTIDIAEWIGKRCTELEPARPCGTSYATCDRRRKSDAASAQERNASLGYYYLKELRGEKPKGLRQ